MVDVKHLLVPIKVQALVINNLVIKQRGVLRNKDQKYVANNGKWSPAVQNYQRLINALDAPGPTPFYGAEHNYKGEPTDQLLLPEGSALPKEKDRGVYLHWVVPPGLRHAYKPNTLDFPALPDQWLIVRFCRQGADPQTRAWFVDSGLVVDSGGDPNLLLADGNRYAAHSVGKVVPLDDFEPQEFEGERTTITAVGNQYTGSPTFTAFIAENRNILSFHDDLEDLGGQKGEGKLPKNTALSYLLLGWYRDKKNEPFVALPAQLAGKDVLEALGWSIDAAQPLPADLLERRCIFHGMVAHINYWNPDTYKGTMLGYPGSPSVEGTLGDAPPSFKVGIGNSAEDALVSLVSSEFSGEEGKANLWKALEAFIYHQPESLIGSWNAAPRDHIVHQSWFTTVEAGKVWSIRPRPGNASGFPGDPEKVTAQTAVKPTPEQLADLKKLNEKQSKADAKGRELAALQQDMYARWWKLCERTRRERDAYPADEEEACQTLAGRIATLRSERDRLLAELQPLPEAIKSKLHEELELSYDAAPRFWTPADPVVVVKNCGQPTKHQFPRPLPCRLPEHTATAAEVEVADKSKKVSAPVGVSQVNAAVQTHFSSQSETLKRLVEEASLVEQAVSDLVERTLATEVRRSSADDWRRWTNRLVYDITWVDNRKPLPTDKINLTDAGAARVWPHRLADLWVRQPWSPLFINWQITWRPTPDTNEDFDAVWRLGQHDYKPTDMKYLSHEGSSVQGRSLLSPIDDRLFKEPINTLRELLEGKPRQGMKEEGNPAFPAIVAEILRNYRIVWDKTLKELAGAGLMGQALTGFHQALLGRDVTLPRVMPDPARPWADADDLDFREETAKALLNTPDEALLAGERLAPPFPEAPRLPFTMLRAGTFVLDELWLIDDFGQWADLLHGTVAGGAAGQVFHPRVRWFENRFAVAMPPRVVQPMRLNFRFTSADNCQVESDCDPALSPICGWIFYNPLDQALVLCDKDGRLAGNLVITEEKDHFLVNWDKGAGGVALNDVRNPTLKAFAQALVETVPTANPRLPELLGFINRALERIRPAAARRDAALFGRPLALVSAQLGLELFGKAWTDPQQPPAADSPSGTGNETLDKLRVRVNLGCSHSVEDGLVGFFKAGNFNQIVPAHLPKEIKPSAYIADPETNAAQIGFNSAEPLTLLMDPWGSVQAAAGLVPAKTITLAQAELDKTLARMEASFRVGPVLLQPDKLALPTPAADKGRWNFIGPLTGDAVASIIPSDPRYFSDRPVVATEGRLILKQEE